MATAMSNRLAYNRERLAKLSQSVIFRQPERLYDGYLQKIDQLQLRLKQGMRDAYGQGANQLQGLRQSPRSHVSFASHRALPRSPAPR